MSHTAHSATSVSLSPFLCTEDRGDNGVGVCFTNQEELLKLITSILKPQPPDLTRGPLQHDRDLTSDSFSSLPLSRAPPDFGF